MRKIADLLNEAKKRTSTTVNRATAAIVALAMLGTVAGVSATAMAQDENASDAQTQTTQATQAQTTDGQAADGQGSQANSTQSDANAAQVDDAQVAETQTIQSDNSGANDSASDASDGGISPYALNDYTVQGVSPSGTTINAFDYWVCDTDPTQDNTDCDGIGDSGINAGHNLKFRTNDNTFRDSINKWTTNSTPRQGLVSNTLVDGYPQLNSTYDSESLSYLFNGNNVNGKSSYMGTSGLLQVDSKGYYYYNALATAYQNGTFDSANFATLDTNSKAWTLYNTWAVHAGGNDSSMNGQFFPFNHASTVFSEGRNGLAQRNIESKAGALDHYFGLSMSSRFVQPTNGVIEEGVGKGETMQYHFSGDDDVWVYIDDVLVGDLGGIHNASTLDINFATGAVSVSGVRQTNLRALYAAAQKTGATTWRGNTFADGTYHTLKFFYLERGNTDSNMSLKFNLKTIPESEIHKVDQNNGAVANAGFTLYTSDAQYGNLVEVGHGTTDAQGTLVLQDDEGKIVSFDDLHTQGKDYYVLKETSVPAGYRQGAASTVGLYLHYVEDTSSTSGTRSGVVVSSYNKDDAGSLWNTGSLALGKVTTTASTEVKDIDGNDVDPSQGIMFAVVLKHDKSKSIDDADAWRGVYGSQLGGWKYETTGGMDGIVKTIKAMNPNGGTANVFTLQTSGSYAVTIEDMPGDIQQYYYMLQDNQKNDADYTVAYYHSTASTVNGVTADNTRRLDFSGFSRQFSANFYVSNIKNELFVQKVDESGKSIASYAQFKLYRLSDSVTGDGDCDSVDTANAAAYDTLNVNGNTKPDNLAINGSGIMPTAQANNGAGTLNSGTYCLVETSAPTNYKVNEHRSKIVVTNSGVFADAGTQNDGLKVLRGVGWLVRPLSMFATNDDVNNTLTWVKSTPGTVTGFNTGSGSDAAGTPNVSFDSVTAYRSKVSAGEVTANTTTSTDALQLKYDTVGEGAVLTNGYSPRNADGDMMYMFDTGMGIISTTQDGVNKEDSDYSEYADHMDLGSTRLSGAVTGSVVVQFTDGTYDAKARISLNKKVVGGNWSGANNKNFTFTLIRTDSETGEVTAGETKLTQCTAADWNDCSTLSAHTVGEISSGSTQRVGVKDDGSITDGAFAEMTFGQQGTYTFSIAEKKDTVAGWNFDTKTHTATVTVARNNDGSLTATVKYDNDGDEIPTFTNSYVAVSALPLTGGMSARNWLIFGGLAVVAAAVVAMIVNEYRKRNGLML
ncbi:hypothetical protein BLI708_01260 [Bifidobacterium imperatoris]|uniref:PA14 domain-containing protein n=1 Tax=Bifidobacterium imperatoris TaxID=2020965 RepID=A0A2N5IS56_9BIFI|nr:FctA domain-containing protein [Bifidobacterium imperatoris]PLS24792.1 hypothetical protein Tam1G_1120 [Bifidobacterium imperatoris]QSY57988.1 hypothetical protein BLI708_01260 [Bifidobacterium imperatoris]